LNTLVYLAGHHRSARRDGAKPAQSVLSVDHVTLKGSASNGIVLRDGAGFDRIRRISPSLELHNTRHRLGGSSGTLPGARIPQRATILSPGIAGKRHRRDITIHDRGVPYHIGHATSSAICAPKRL